MRLRPIRTAAIAQITPVIGDHAHQIAVENPPAAECPLGKELDRGERSQVGCMWATSELSGRCRLKSSFTGPLVMTHSNVIATMNTRNSRRCELNTAPSPAAKHQRAEYRPVAERAAAAVTRRCDCTTTGWRCTAFRRTRRCPRIRLLGRGRTASFLRMAQPDRSSLHG